MFRSAAPTYCALFLALSHIYTHTYSRTISLNPLKPPLYPFVSFSPRRSRFLPLSYRALLLRNVAARWKVRCSANGRIPGKKYARLFEDKRISAERPAIIISIFNDESPPLSADERSILRPCAYSFPARFPTTKSRSLVPNWILPVRISNSRTRYGGASRCESLVRSSRARIPSSPLAPLPRVRSYFYFAYPPDFHISHSRLGRDCYYPS